MGGEVASIEADGLAHGEAAGRIDVSATIGNIIAEGTALTVIEMDIDAGAAP